MSVNEVMMVGGGYDTAQKNCVNETIAKTENTSESGIFNLKFEPGSFGGKNYSTECSTSIFDDWDS